MEDKSTFIINNLQLELCGKLFTIFSNVLVYDFEDTSALPAYFAMFIKTA